jgi:hypothetical protein
VWLQQVRKISDYVFIYQGSERNGKIYLRRKTSYRHRDFEGSSFARGKFLKPIFLKNFNIKKFKIHKKIF